MRFGLQTKPLTKEMKTKNAENKQTKNLQNKQKNLLRINFFLPDTRKCSQKRPSQLTELWQFKKLSKNSVFMLQLKIIQNSQSLLERKKLKTNDSNNQ
jgi:hypothetical protein